MFKSRCLVNMSTSVVQLVLLFMCCYMSIIVLLDENSFKS